MRFFLLSVFLFAVSSNVDNLFVGLSYGVKKIHITPAANLLVAFITFAGTILSMWLGKCSSHLISANASGMIGSLILIAIGLVSIFKHLRPHSADDAPWPVKNPEQYDENGNKSIEWREAVLLGLALSANNIGLGIGAGIAGLHVLPTAAASFAFSLLFLHIGNYLGNSCFSMFFSKYADLASGFMIIALGLRGLLF